MSTAEFSAVTHGLQLIGNYILSHYREKKKYKKKRRTYQSCLLGVKLSLPYYILRNWSKIVQSWQH